MSGNRSEITGTTEYFINKVTVDLYFNRSGPKLFKNILFIRFW